MNLISRLSILGTILWAMVPGIPFAQIAVPDTRPGTAAPAS